MRIGLLVLMAMLLATPLARGLELASPFVDGAIVQRQMHVPVWGWAKPGGKITVVFAGQTKTATVGEDGRWMVKLDPMPASAEPRAMTVRASNEPNAVTVDGVLVGEVWLSSGQSNMDWTAGKSMCRELASELSRAEKDVPIREFEVDTGSSMFPQDRVDSQRGWKHAKDAGGFSALSLSFAHKLYQELGVPIGILRSTHGATQIETWTPYQGFAAQPQLKDIALMVRQGDPSTPAGKKAYEQFYQDLRQWQRDSEAIMNRGGRALPRPTLPGIASQWRGPTRMYNKKINGFAPYAIRGMIWCQGTHNAGDGRIYAAKMQALVDGIRQVWGRPNLPFYFTQMQCYGSPNPDSVGFADIREVQRLFFMNNLDNHVGMVVQHDFNSARPQGIHYFNKLHPGWRMARWALAHEYGREKLAYTGPLYKSHTIEGNTVRVRFEQPGPGGKLMVGSKGMAKDYRDPDKYVEPARPTPGEKLKHFRLADKNGKWHAAEAVIDGMEVVVTSDAVDEPTGVQYAYSAVPEGANLYNEAGLPATAFAYLNGKQLFQEDMRAPKQETATTAAPARRPYLGIMTPFRNGVVIQRDKPAPLWGFAVPGAKVTVKFAGQTKTAVADEFDRWRVTLDPMPAHATGRDLVVTTSDGKSATVRDVLVGDVWFFTGTTDLNNMVVNRRDKDAVAPADMSLLREFRIRTKARRNATPRKRRMEVGGGKYSSRWVTAEAKDGEMDITAAAYHFAKQVAEPGVPIGILNMSAPNPPLTWMSHKAIQTAEGFEDKRDEINLAYPNTEACKRAIDQYIDDLKAYCQKIVALREEGQTIPPELAERVPSLPQPPYNQWSNETETATYTYNWCVAPNTPLAVAGVVWLPGRENIGSDAARYSQAVAAYAKSLPQTYDQATVRFVYAHPSAELLSGMIEKAEGVNRPLSPLGLKHAARVEFTEWPKDMAAIGAKLGEAAKGLK